MDSFEKILQTEVNTLAEILGMEGNPNSIEDLVFKINLYLERKLYVKKLVDLPNPKDVVFYDIEASAHSHNMFLVTFLEDGNDPVSIYNIKRHVFEERIVEYLREHLTKIFVSSSGNHFDKKYLIKPLKAKGLWSAELDGIQFLDLMAYLKPKVVTPVGFSVKKLSHLFGYPDYEAKLNDDPLIKSLIKKLGIRPKKDSLGYLFALAYEKRVLNREIWKKMIEYNVYDVEALKFIYSRFYALIDGLGPDEYVNY